MEVTHGLEGDNMSFLATIWRQPFEQPGLKSERMTLEPIGASHADELPHGPFPSGG
jgi:hypothetical protein